MTSTICLLSEKHLLCHLCREIFTSPVTTPCGHSFCKACLRHYWSRHQTSYCPNCRRVFPSTPDLSVNRILADVSDKYRGSRPQTSPVKDMIVDVEQLIKERMQKRKRLKYSLQLIQNSCLKEVRESQKVFSALVNCMERGHKAVVAAIEQRQSEEEKKIEKLLEELEQEIKQLKNDLNPQLSDEQVEEKERVKMSASSLSLDAIDAPDLKDWAEITIDTEPCVGLTRRVMSDMLEKIKGEVNRLSKSELKKVQKYTVEVNLSPKTAHAVLSISEDRKQVRHTDKLQEVPDNPRRFDRVSNVLGRESFSSGRFYWEVEVGDKIEWSLGAVRQSINRKGKFTVCPANGFWTLSLKPGGQYLANTSPATPVALEQRPRRVGMFLDHTEGRMSFYCAETGVHIHTFMDTFTDLLHPFFNPGRLHGGKNSAPLIIASSVCNI